MRKDPLFDAIYEWLNTKKFNNPSFSLILGDKNYTVKQALDHITKDTEEGQELKKMIFVTFSDVSMVMTTLCFPGVSPRYRIGLTRESLDWVLRATPFTLSGTAGSHISP